MSHAKPGDAGGDGHHVPDIDLGSHRLRYYVAISVRSQTHDDGTRENAYYLMTMDGPGARLHVQHLETNLEACDHITCNLGHALDVLRAAEAQILLEDELRDSGQLELPL